MKNLQTKTEKLKHERGRMLLVREESERGEEKKLREKKGVGEKIIRLM